MPKKCIDYSKTIIYKIVCKDLNIKDLYVGHTTNFFERKRSLKANTNSDKRKDHNMKVYNYIRNTGGWDNWEMIQIETFPCSNSNEARARERYWMETLCANLNCNKSFTTQEE